MKAGISEFTGKLKDGILHLDVGDEYVLVFARDGADTSSLSVVTQDEYKEILMGGETAPASSSVAGRYAAYAVESQGRCILLPKEDQSALIFTLNDDGTGTVESGGESQEMLWKLDGDVLTFHELSGESATEKYTITVKDGIMSVLVPGQEGDADITEYLVTDTADTSEIDAKAAASS